MTDRIYTASRLNAELLDVLDSVDRSGESVTITKDGRPVARIVPFAEAAPLAGSVTFHITDDELAAPSEEAWHADRR